MIPRILKGSTSAEVSVAITGGIPASAMLELEYQGVKRTFAPGDTVAVIFTAEETANFRLGTFPVRLRLIHENGNVAELSNPGGKITVTDCPALVSGGTVAVSVRSILEGVSGLGDRFRDVDVKTLLNTIVARLGGTVVAFALCLVLPVFGASISVTTAPKGALYNDEEVVTGVALDTSGLATSNDLAQESEARYALETNLLAQIAAATPADYNTVKEQVSTNAADIATLKTGKQDLIADLSDIRSGAALGATALQSYTETDPVWTADKPDYATLYAVEAVYTNAWVNGDTICVKSGNQWKSVTSANTYPHIWYAVNGYGYNGSSWAWGDYWCYTADGTTTILSTDPASATTITFTIDGSPVTFTHYDTYTLTSPVVYAKDLADYEGDPVFRNWQTNVESVAVGQYAAGTTRIASQNPYYAVAIGKNVKSSGSIAIGQDINVSALASVVIGNGAGATNDSAVVIGPHAISHGHGTVNLHANQLEKIYLGDTNIVELINAAVNDAIASQSIPEAVSVSETETATPRRVLLAAAAPGSTTKTEVTAADVGALSTESDPTVPSWAKAADKPEYGWSEITNKPAFATVATSGAYSDLSGKPTIPTVPTKLSAFTNDVGYLRKGDTIKLGSHDDVILEMSGLTIQDEDEGHLEGVFFDYEELEWWDGSASGRIHYADIANRSDIPTVPTNVSAFTNDAGYLTQHQSLSGYATKTWVGNQGYLTSYTETDPNAAGIASNVVTTAYIREKLGVYLYIGEDNGIYVHTPSNEE